MTQTHIIQELKNLTTEERLEVIEAAIELIRAELHQTDNRASNKATKTQLTEAAEAMLEEYNTDEELTIFTSLDSEDFHG